MRKPLTLLPTALLLASCGATDTQPTSLPPPQETVAPEPTFVAPEPITLDGQTLEYTTMDGTKGALTIPAEPLPDVEQYLNIVGHPKPVTYAVVDVDNRGGMSEYGVYDINLYTPEGDVVTFQNVNNQVIEWDHDVPPEAVDLYYSLGDTDDVAVGQRTDDYAITDQELPKKVSRIDVTQTGGGIVQVYPEVPEEEKTSAEMQQEWVDAQ